ncbi:hypothetical protein V6N13_013041 [Hibiscus sabdariffa]
MKDLIRRIVFTLPVFILISSLSKMGCGFCESALSNSVGTLVVDSVVKPVGRQLDYVRHFHDNVEKLRERKNELATARTRLQHEIEGAEGQLLQIEDDVRCLQSKADATLSYVETLENEIQQNKSCLKWCPNWSWRYQLSKKAKKKTMDISELLETISTFGQPGRVGYPATSLSESSNDDIQKLAKQIIKKCQGLSIAIVTLGSALKGKSYHGWEAAYRRLKNRRLTEIEDFNEENAYLCLEASFDYLKNMETKICFLLCSLFPEDYKIYVEDLVRFAWGLELYKDTNSINEVRNEVLAAIEILKNSCLLLDCGKRHVKMHDLVREVALWIASPGKEISFAIKSEVAETLPNVGSLKHYTAISFKSNQTRELPEGLAFPNLKIFLHGGVGISGEILQGMKALQVFALDDGWISPAAFQCQSKLRTLKLYRCNLSDISMLGRLKALEILSLNRSGIIELPNEIGDLENLRLLDLSNCAILQRIPHNLIGRLSNLEEVYLHGCRWIKWATENSTAEEESYSSLWELNLLPKLDVLSLDISCQHLPDGFVFRQLRSFKVCIGKQLQVLFWKSDFETCPISRCLRIENSVDAFKQLLEDVESLELQRVGGHRNLVPSLDFGQGGFNKLTSLHLEGCASLKCLIDASKQQMPATATALSNLVELSIREMVGLEELCNGVQPRGFLQNLKTLNMFNCEEMIGGIPILQNLEQLKVKGCKKMQVLFQISEQGSTHHFSLQSLKVVEIDGCNSLKHLFPMCVANGLGQLQTLKISECSQLEEIIQQPEATNICLQSLKVVQIDGCGSLKYLFPMCLGNGLRQLQTLKMRRCGQLEEIIQQPQATNICVQSLREVDVAECDKLTSLSSLSHGQRMENLTRLTIYCCRQFEYTFPISMVEGLPLLNYVWLHNLPEFKGRDGNDIVLTPPSLHNLSVEKCPQLTPFIISAKIQRLTLSGIEEMKQTCNRMVPKLRGELSGKMEYLTIPNSEHLFDSGYNLSSLKSLLLISLTELRVIWNGPIQVENFQNLTVLYISNCLKLRYIFTVTIAQNLPQLSGLSIGYCLALEQIIEQDQTSSQDHLQPICFPNLSKIDISECGSLKCILPVTVVHGGLPKLETLILDGVPKLEEVFEGDEANEEEKVIHLPQFKYLLLHSLPNCASLNPVGYHFVFPSLEEICVGSCPNITTSFSVDSKKSVHAKTQASQSVDEITAQESASAQETTWPLAQCITYSIHCGASLFFVSGVYGFNLGSERLELWQHLADLNNVIGDRPWLMGGDFNIIDVASERSVAIGASLEHDIDAFNACLGVTKDPEFLELVATSWREFVCAENPLHALFLSLKPILRGLNARRYSDLSQRVVQKKSELEACQLANLVGHHTPATLEREQSIFAKLQGLLAAEESLLRQKSRELWRMQGAVW